VIVSVDPGLALPVYEQVREQITRMVTSRNLPVGTQLPTIRQLASDLGLAKGTIAKAYELLESQGLIESRGRHGTFVADTPMTSAKDRRAALHNAAQSFVVLAQQLGADETAMISAASSAWRRTAIGQRRRDSSDQLLSEPSTAHAS
jgi:GntR family transcriptional regulator